MQLQRSGQLWQKLSVSGSAGKSPWTLLLVVQPCPPLFGVFLRFLGPGSMPFLQATPCSWLLSISPREREEVSVPWPALSLNSFTHRERYSLLLKHHGTQAAHLILGSDSWLCKWNIKHLSHSHSLLQAHSTTRCFPTELGLHAFELATLASAQHISPHLRSSCHLLSWEPDVSSSTRLPLIQLIVLAFWTLQCSAWHYIGGDGRHLQPEEYLSILQ